ncbi:MAG: RagB/SusD family nutrient uptake outer membrane protein [Saprospiraceae bacterium]|nr:RagB/SusD family nutrient uptake outer membrane protein [Saprospiraceae bacterium]
MTKAIYLIIISGILFSCQGILDKEPIATLDAGSFFKTEADAIQAINAAYGPLMFNNENNNFYWAFSTITSDEAITGGDGSRPGLVEMDAFTYTPRTEEFNTFWKVNYEGITQCNVVLANLDKAEMTEAKRNEIKGEALFLRSYYYFLLSQVFGDVPLFTSLVAPENLKVAKTATSVVLAQIYSDCDEAAGYLPSSRPMAQLGRATKGAALALAAKTALYQKEYNRVIEKTGQLKALNVYSLMADYRDNFKKSTQNNVESVWEIQHTNLQLGLGNFLNQWWMSKKLAGYGFAEAREELVKAYEIDDPRRKFTIAMNNEDYFGVVYKNSFSSTRYSPIKYLQNPAEVTQPADGDINYTAIRYAEVLLWEAEALNELGRVAEAAIPLEEVRSRARNQAGNPTTALPKISTTDIAEMRAAIRHERQVELAFELHRFFDLVRWGIAGDLLPGFVKDKHERFPLPQTEIDLNANLLQNPGY